MCKQHLRECKCGKTYDIRDSNHEELCSTCKQKKTKEESKRRLLRGTRSDSGKTAMGKDYVRYYAEVE